MIGYILSILAIAIMAGIIPTIRLVYRKHIKFLSGVFLGTFLFLLSFGCATYSAYLNVGYSPIDHIINSMFDEFNVAFNSVPGFDPASLSQIKQYVESVREMYFILFPSMLVISALTWSYVLHMVAKGILALFGKDVSGFAKFCDFKMPKGAIFLTVVSYLMYFAFGEQRIGYAFLNLASILTSVTAVCGLSVIDFKLRKVIKYSILRFPIYAVGLTILSILFLGVENILAIVGMADTIFDFRRPRVKPEDKNQ